jgi:hypothetical protein
MREKLLACGEEWRWVTSDEERWFFRSFWKRFFPIPPRRPLSRTFSFSSLLMKKDYKEVTKALQQVPLIRVLQDLGAEPIAGDRSKYATVVGEASISWGNQRYNIFNAPRSSDPNLKRYGAISLVTEVRACGFMEAREWL